MFVTSFECQLTPLLADGALSFDDADDDDLTLEYEEEEEGIY